MRKMNRLIFKNSRGGLKKLVKLMNRQNRRFIPPVDALLNAIDLIVTEDELGLLLKMGTDRHTYEEALKLSAMDRGRFDAVFESLKRKGFIGSGYISAETESFALQPVIVGWFEAQVMYLMGRPEEKEFARRYIKFFETFRDRNNLPNRFAMNAFQRLSAATNQSVGAVRETGGGKKKSTIEINEDVNVSDSKIYPSQFLNDIILEYGKKGVMGQFKACMCRQITSNIDDPCRLKMPGDLACLNFAPETENYISYGHARKISTQEAIDIIQKARDCGAVHTVFHELDDSRLPQIGVCNCCWDCCGILRSYNMGAVPLKYSCFFMAEVSDISKCTGCKICEKYCPTAAITVSEKKAAIDAKKCIGCGQCAHQCPKSAVRLTENKRTAFLPMLKRFEARIMP
jgi:Pyruvate/2-oxoacid:ferredoxin oxidoreductase delta subunit